jgi:hypothetical protein
MRVYFPKITRKISKVSPLILDLVAILLSAPVYAQAISPEGEKPSNRRTLEEVIVTALKKETSMQVIPVPTLIF